MEEKVKIDETKEETLLDYKDDVEDTVYTDYYKIKFFMNPDEKILWRSKERSVPKEFDKNNISQATKTLLFFSIPIFLILLLFGQIMLAITAILLIAGVGVMFSMLGQALSIGTTSPLQEKGLCVITDKAVYKQIGLRSTQIADRVFRVEYKYILGLTTNRDEDDIQNQTGDILIRCQYIEIDGGKNDSTGLDTLQLNNLEDYKTAYKLIKENLEKEKTNG